MSKFRETGLLRKTVPNVASALLLVALFASATVDGGDVTSTDAGVETLVNSPLVLLSGLSGKQTVADGDTTWTLRELSPKVQQGIQFGDLSERRAIV